MGDEQHGQVEAALQAVEEVEHLGLHGHVQRRHGLVVEHGPTERVFASPEHPYTRALLDAAPGRGFGFGKAA